MGKLYVAYGSNLNVEQMLYRCPDAKIAGIGILRNWRLLFRGSKTGAYLTIKREKGINTPVAIWEISKRDEYYLDRYEGFPSFYGKQNVMVDTGSGRIKGMVYVMTRNTKPGIPSDGYVKTCRQGYMDNGLDLHILEEALEYNAKECK